MECNKDEATRAKEIAEKKFTVKDIAGAKKFALKAQNLYPGLEGIPQLLATLDVYNSAENKMFGEADWYGILGVNPGDDDETVRKHYRKLALMLHPDKNKSVGAEGAFKHVSEAWSLLSDKAKRTAYDHKRNTKIFQQNARPPTGGPSAPSSANGFYSFTKTKSTITTSVKAQKSTPRVVPSSVPPPPHKAKPNTFWTVCHQCKMHYEYLRVYLNHNLLCPNCHEPFFAVEIEPSPPNGSRPSSTWDFSQKWQNSNHQTASKKIGRTSVGANASDTCNSSNFQWGPFSRTSGASSAAQAATVVQQAYEKVKREREEAQAATKREEALRRKNYVSKKTSTGVVNNLKRRRGLDYPGFGNNSRENTTQHGRGTAGATRVNGINKPNTTRELSQLEIQNMLMTKARVAIRKKLNECNSAPVAEPGVKKMKNGSTKANEKDERNENDLLHGDKDVQNKSDEPDFIGSSIKAFSGSSCITSDAEMVESMSVSVPDPEFHDFDKDRTERSFARNQVWAVYDADDGMPRYYALIRNVISLHPFKMKISWLNSKTNSELGPLVWVGSGFSKTCGDFRVGQHELNNSLNSFSHKVRWSKGTSGAIHIYPRKGDVWALYRNWSPDWDELTADEVIHKYDMVEVLEDYNEEQGVTVIPLVKVAGFKAVFHQHLDPKEIRRIPREQMFRFSHFVPSYLLTGQEAPNAPKGCRELDPAATPLELLQVIAIVKKEEVIENEGQGENENGGNIERASDEGIVEGSKKEGEEIISGSSSDTPEEETLENSDQPETNESNAGHGAEDI